MLREGSKQVAKSLSTLQADARKERPMPYVLRLVDRRVGDGDGRPGALALLTAAALAVIPRSLRAAL